MEACKHRYSFFTHIQHRRFERNKEKMTNPSAQVRVRTIKSTLEGFYQEILQTARTAKQLQQRSLQVAPNDATQQLSHLSNCGHVSKAMNFDVTTVHTLSEWKQENVARENNERASEEEERQNKWLIQHFGACFPNRFLFSKEGTRHGHNDNSRLLGI